MCKQKGFTLIELLVVIAVIAVLMAILMPALRSAREQGRRAVCLSHVKSMMTGIYVYSADYDDQIPASIDGMNASWNFICWQTYDNPPRWINLGRLYGTGIIKDPEIFYCPAQQNPLLKKGRQEDVDGGWTWTSPTGNEMRAISYMYGLLAEIRSAPDLELKSMKLSALKTRALICDVFMPFGEGPVTAHPRGLATGYGAGHVNFVKIDDPVMEIAGKFGAAPGDAQRDERDLFTAAMFDLLAGGQAMEQYFPYRK